jgi:hypothetical protein
MKTLTTALALSVAAAHLLLASPPTRSFYEEEGGFSYDPPTGWALKSIPGFEYKFAVGPEVDGFSPNINVVEEPFSGSVDAYMVEAKKTLSQILGGNLSILSEEKFTTEDGLEGLRMVSVAGHSLDEKYFEGLRKAGGSVDLERILKEEKAPAETLYQTAYVFSTGQKVYIATCTSSVKAGPSLSPVFDKALGTFRVH